MSREVIVDVPILDPLLLDGIDAVDGICNSSLSEKLLNKAFRGFMSSHFDERNSSFTSGPDIPKCLFEVGSSSLHLSFVFGDLLSFSSESSLVGSSVSGFGSGSGFLVGGSLSSLGSLVSC